MKATFADALKYIVADEGGYVDHSQDPGGATNKGITLRTYKKFCGFHKTKADLRAITDAEVEDIYRRGYWDVCHCDLLPVGIDYAVFDQAVNSGPQRSVIWLQKALRMPATLQDGFVGPATLRYFTEAVGDYGDILERMCDLRLRFLQSLPTWPTFGKGWENRLKKVRLRVQQMMLTHKPTV